MTKKILLTLLAMVVAAMAGFTTVAIIAGSIEWPPQTSCEPLCPPDD